MTFIITLISLIIERFFHWDHLRYWNWFGKYQQWLSKRIAAWPSNALLAVCIVPLILLVGLINHFLGGWWYGLFQLLFGIVILLYCMGPGNLWQQTYAVINELHNEDPQLAIKHAQEVFNTPASNNSQEFHRVFTGSIFTAAHQRIFAVVFWFAILGPIGAVLYRAVTKCAQESELGLTQVASNCQRLLEWLPVRLYTLLFALAGHFLGVFRIWKKFATHQVVNELVAECGIAALNSKEQKNLPEDGSAEKSALELLDRTFIIGLVLLAFLVLTVK